MPVIDVHGHFTAVPDAVIAWRGRQITQLNRPSPARVKLSDESLRGAVQPTIDRMDERGIDMMLFSPRAAGMNHDIGDFDVSRYWTELSNDVIARTCALFPDRLVPVAQLPQSPGVSPKQWIDELERAVAELGAVGCIVNPDISGGLAPLTPSLGSQWWWPLWEAAQGLDLPVMIHASATQSPLFHLNGSHYLAQDYAAGVELCASDVFGRFPGLKVVIPHGGAGLPFNKNRHRALHVQQRLAPFDDAFGRLYFDTTVYDEDALALLVKHVSADHLLFGSEMFGTGDVTDPSTGSTFDDILPVVVRPDVTDPAHLSDLLAGNARRVFSRLPG